MAETLTRADVQRIAALARLELTPDEVALFADQLTAILAYADQVQQADTSVVAGLPNRETGDPSDPASVNSGVQQSRGDDPTPSLPRDTVLDQAPDADRSAGVFTVPRVLGS